MALTAGSHAAQACEPRQVRKEATVSDVQRVPWERLARATTYDMPPCCCQREVLDHLPHPIAFPKAASGEAINLIRPILYIPVNP